MAEVWVLETGLHDDRIIQGVFSTADEAKKAWDDRHPHLQTLMIVRGGWVEEDVDWTNSLDWDDHARVARYEVGKWFKERAGL